MNVQHTDSNDNEWLIDMHTHLGFTSNPSEIAADYKLHHIAGLCATVTPYEYQQLLPQVSQHNNVRLGLGAHPWWIHDDRISDDELKLMIEDIPNVNYIAEIGLDFSSRFADATGQDRQMYWFKSICEKISQCIAQNNDSYVLSIHSVRATTEVLDILEHYDLPSNTTCIFHWFSGTHEELLRASRLGCYFSVNANMLRSKRAKSYIQTIPADHILLETDMPEEGQYWNGELERERLSETYNMLRELTPNHTLLTPKQQAQLLGITLI